MTRDEMLELEAQAIHIAKKQWATDGDRLKAIWLATELHEELKTVENSEEA